MEQFDTNTLTLVAVVAVFILVLLSLLWRPKREDGSLSAEVKSLREVVERKERELRDALKRADGGEALAGERKAAIERLNGDLSKLRLKLDEVAKEQQEFASTISGQKKQMEAQQTAAEEKIKFLTELRQDMEAKFRDMAQDALKLQGEAFSKSNIGKLDAALSPLKEHVGHFEKELKNVHQETVKDRERLKAEIVQLTKRSEAISNEAVALTRALKGDQQQQGAWGEMILENILERSGLRKGEEYETQAHRTGQEGERLRPDVVVKIPGGKTLVVDSKVSLVAYTDIVNSDTEDERAAALKRHVLSLKQHISGLASKGYQNAEGTTVDYVILFVPIEGALSEALRGDGRLIEHAIEKNITIATPTTLMMALKTIASVWTVERRNQNAEEIASRAGSLYDKVSGFVSNMKNVGKRLDQAQEAYGNAFDQLSRGRGNVLSQVEALKSLGAKTNKSLSVDCDNDDQGTVLLEASIATQLAEDTAKNSEE